MTRYLKWAGTGSFIVASLFGTSVIAATTPDLGDAISQTSTDLPNANKAPQGTSVASSNSSSEATTKGENPPPTPLDASSPTSVEPTLPADNTSPLAGADSTGTASDAASQTSADSPMMSSSDSTAALTGGDSTPASTDAPSQSIDSSTSLADSTPAVAGGDSTPILPDTPSQATDNSTPPVDNTPGMDLTGVPSDAVPQTSESSITPLVDNTPAPTGGDSVPTSPDTLSQGTDSPTPPADRNSATTSGDSTPVPPDTTSQTPENSTPPVGNSMAITGEEPTRTSISVVPQSSSNPTAPQVHAAQGQAPQQQMKQQQEMPQEGVQVEIAGQQAYPVQARQQGTVREELPQAVQPQTGQETAQSPQLTEAPTVPPYQNSWEVEKAQPGLPSYPEKVAEPNGSQAPEPEGQKERPQRGQLPEAPAILDRQPYQNSWEAEREFIEKEQRRWPSYQEFEPQQMQAEQQYPSPYERQEIEESRYRPHFAREEGQRFVHNSSYHQEAHREAEYPHPIHKESFLSSSYEKPYEVAREPSAERAAHERAPKTEQENVKVIPLPDDSGGVLGSRWGGIFDPVLTPRVGSLEGETGDEKIPSDRQPKASGIIGKGYISADQLEAPTASFQETPLPEKHKAEPAKGEAKAEMNEKLVKTPATTAGDDKPRQNKVAKETVGQTVRKVEDGSQAHKTKEASREAFLDEHGNTVSDEAAINPRPSQAPDPDKKETDSITGLVDKISQKNEPSTPAKTSIKDEVNP